jgi:hypothetical protein
MKTIATCHDIALNVQWPPLMIAFNLDTRLINASNLQGLNLIEAAKAACSPMRHQILGNFGLPIDHNLLTSGERMKINTMPPALKQQFEAMVDKPLAM